MLPTLFVPMTGISEDKREVKPDPLKPRIVNGSFEFDKNEDGRADNWHYQRQTHRLTTSVTSRVDYCGSQLETVAAIFSPET